MEDHRIEADTIEETEAKREFVKLFEDTAADFYYCKLGGLGRV
jgi:hypothetical protein